MSMARNHSCGGNRSDDGAAVAAMHDAPQGRSVDAEAAYLSSSQQQRRAANRPVVVQRLHHRDAGAVTDAINAWREQREKIMDVNESRSKRLDGPHHRCDTDWIFDGAHHRQGFVDW